MNELLLTPEERNKVRGKRTYLSRDSFEDELLQAQLNKLLKWLDELCPEHSREYIIPHRRECPDCWQRALAPE